MSSLNKGGFRATAKHLDPKSVQFSVLTPEDIKNLSVKEITTPDSFNILGYPLIGGLHDPALGPLDERSDPCGTCGNNIIKCTGHFGHINLPVPIVNPLFHKILQTLIETSCLNCFTLQIYSYEKILLSATLELIEKGFFAYIDGLYQEVLSLPELKGKNLQDAVIYNYMEDVIKSYVQNITNKERNTIDHSNKTYLNTKNLNLLRRTYIENFLKTLKTKKSRRVCMNCQGNIPKITVIKNRIMTTITLQSEEGAVHKVEKKFIMPGQSKEYMRKLWYNEKETLKVIIPCLNDLNIEHPTDVFFYDAILVMPPTVRPVNLVNGQVIEHPQTQVYRSIILNCLTLRNIMQAMKDGDTSQLPDSGKLVVSTMRGNTLTEKMHNAWLDLQANGDHLIDRDLSKNSDSASCLGLKQVLEKKEGVIRMHMMGKRVNFAARSVITPDPNLNIDEIGVPEEFAKKLTYAVPVTPWNVAELRQLVLNGPENYPGAVMIEGEDGMVRRLSPNNDVQRQASAKRLLTMTEKATKFFDGVKVVHRHLQNGDMLLLNRQPTLHKPSIMAHKARILRGEKTLRLHYANCKTYNADFDGDEMNAHFPQNEVARAEACFIANVQNQYLVPKDGTPLSGLIQDHVISGLKLSLRGNFFHKEDYQQLVYSALATIRPGNIQLLPPAILKPVALWSGKQVISSVIVNVTPRGKALINLLSTAKVRANAWQNRKPRAWKCGVPFDDPNLMSEAEVVVRNGELLCGVLDKNHYGATPYGLVHCVYELYGGETSCKLLSAFGKLFQAYLQRIGFTLGIEDILVKKKADKKRAEIMRECQLIGEGIQRSVLELPEDTPMNVVKKKFEEAYWGNPKFRAQVDRKYKSALDIYTNKINKTCLPGGLIKAFPDNNLQLMVQSGAKGSTVNTMQISCLLGQIELEGKRPPLMMSGKSLPSFSAYDPSPRAGGFVDGRFMTGIRPQEYFFHCMAGREGLIDTAVKTSRSGYLQRCLVKHLEGLMVNYDATVRDYDGSLIQFYYGEDGLDIPKSRFLNDKQFKFLVENRNAIVDHELLEQMKRDSDPKPLKRYLKKLNKWKKRYGDPRARMPSGFTRYSAEHWDPNSVKSKTINESCGRTKAALSLMRKWLRSDDETRNLYKAQCVRCPEPLNSVYRQDQTFGVLPEKLEELLDDYLKKNPNSTSTRDELRELLCAKFMCTICPPGEPVGLLAAQSIGEPSTQLTLNTFHTAGRGEMNVTLGIPRLREILMTASKNIKTPSMEIPFKSDLRKLDKQSNKLKMKLSKCYLADVLKEIRIDRKLQLEPKRQMNYKLHMEFLPYKCYKKEFNVRPSDAIETVKKKFIRELFRKIKEDAKYTSGLIYYKEEKKEKMEDTRLDEGEVENEQQSTSRARIDLGEGHESSDEEEVAEDADATVARRLERHCENREYDDEEDEEDRIQQRQPDEENNEEEKEENAENEERPVQEGDLLQESEDEHHLDKMNGTLEDNKKDDILQKNPYAIDFVYDREKYEWCDFTLWLPIKLTKLDMPTIIRTVANNVVLWQTPEIKKAFTFQNPKGETILKTDGINIMEMFKYDEILDLNRLYSNDIYAISQIYGIEAATRVIIKEVQDVFKMYGIGVDSRHLLLIADYMTFDGTFEPMSRKGMENSASPLQQMSFESSLNFLKSATLEGKRDDLTSPSSRLIMGQPFKAGTGSFSLLVDLRKQIQMNKHAQPLSFTL